MTDIAELTNSRKREWERFNNVIRMSKLIQPRIENLVNPQRRLIWEGPVKLILLNGIKNYAEDNFNKEFEETMKKAIKKQKPKEWILLLFNDQLIFTKKFERESTSSTNLEANYFLKLKKQCPFLNYSNNNNQDIPNPFDSNPQTGVVMKHIPPQSFGPAEGMPNSVYISVERQACTFVASISGIHAEAEKEELLKDFHAFQADYRQSLSPNLNRKTLQLKKG